LNSGGGRGTIRDRKKLLEFYLRKEVGWKRQKHSIQVKKVELTRVPIAGGGGSSEKEKSMVCKEENLRENGGLGRKKDPEHQKNGGWIEPERSEHSSKTFKSAENPPMFNQGRILRNVPLGKR